MVIASTLVFTSAVIMGLFDVGLQFECLPNGEPIPGVSRGESSSLDKYFSADMSPPAARPDSLLQAPSSSEEPSRVRSRSPTARHMILPTKIDSFYGIQFELNQLESIRLTCYKNPRRVFELRRYTFPANKTIRLLAQTNVYVPMPKQEQIVLSTPGGDVFAILTNNVFAGIYSSRGGQTGNVRSKISMDSGSITRLTKDEVDEIPVGYARHIRQLYIVERVNHNSLLH